MDVRMRTRRDGGQEGGRGEVGGVNEKIKGRCGRKDGGERVGTRDRRIERENGGKRAR